MLGPVLLWIRRMLVGTLCTVGMFVLWEGTVSKGELSASIAVTVGVFAAIGIRAPRSKLGSGTSQEDTGRELVGVCGLLVPMSIVLLKAVSAL